MAEKISLNEKWTFHLGDIPFKHPPTKGPAYSQSKTERRLHGPASYHYFDKPDQFYANEELHYDGWKYVDLPHDYVVEGEPKRELNNSFGFLKYDNAWYRRHFTVDESNKGKRITLVFEGVTGRSTVYVNGCLIGHNFSSYNSFELDISDYVYFDRDNVIAVYVNTDEWEGWWYQGGGIYRDVTLNIYSELSIDRYGVYVPYERLDNGAWKLNYQTEVVNSSYEKAAFTLKSELIDKDGNVVSVCEGSGECEGREHAVVKYSDTVSGINEWNVDSPYLYTVRTSLLVNNEKCDEDITRTGFRTYTITAEDGMLINGKKVYINGVCAHQDFGLTGLAVPDNIARYKISLIKEMGANGYRCSHYEQNRAYMDAFDEMGFIVMAEARWFESTKESIEQLTSLVKRDRNRPSVFFWSTGNEEPTFVTDVGLRIHKAMAAEIRKLDNTRFITAAVDKTPDKCTIYDECDIVGINYNLHIYDTVHTIYPNKPIFASECCATGTTRDWNFDSELIGGRIKDKDIDTNSWFRAREATYKHLSARPYVIGGYQWAAVEHRGEAAWPRICSTAGAIDLFLQKKGAFYQNLSFWSEKPMLHIVPHWNFEGLEGQDILVTVYTNCPEVELFLNGKSLGKKQVERLGHAQWNVPYEKGTLEAVGVKDGEKVRDVRATTGKPVSLKLKKVNDFEKNGSDMALFDCICLDSEGREVPDASETVKFSVAAPALFIGSGSDNADHTPVTSNIRKMYMGVIRIAVKPQKGQDKIKVMAMTDSGMLATIEA